MGLKVVYGSLKAYAAACMIAEAYAKMSMHPKIREPEYIRCRMPVC